MVETTSVVRHQFSILHAPCHIHILKSVHAYYIYHKNKKGKPPKKDLPLLKNDITNNLGPQKPVIYSRYMKSGLSSIYVGDI